MFLEIFRKPAQKTIRFLIWGALLSLRLLTRWLPLQLTTRAGAHLGSLAYGVLRSERHRALRHLELALGSERSEVERQAIARESFRNLGRTFFEVIKLDRLDGFQLGERVRFEGEERLKAAVASGRGVLFVTAHLGNWELMAAVVSMRYPLAVVAAPIYDPRLEGLMIRIRAAHGIETLVRDSPGMLRRTLAMLKRGGVVGILIDQDTRVDGVFVPFFGHAAYTPAGAARLGLRSGAAVVAGFIRREADGTHRVLIDGPFEMKPGSDPERDIQYETARLSKIIEERIRETPEQWVWMHRRWRTSKPESPSP